MEIRAINEGNLTDMNIKLLVKFYKKDTPQVYLGKILIDNYDDAVFMLRFPKDRNLQETFLHKFGDYINEIIDAYQKASNLREFFDNVQPEYDIDIYQKFTLEDIYSDYDITSNYEDVLSDIDMDLKVKSVSEDHDENMQLVNDVINSDFGEDVNFTEEVKEKYVRRGFRRDAKNPLVPVKIFTSKGHYITYYVRKSRLDEYTKRNRVVDGRWKYLFYTDEIEKSMKKAPDTVKNFTKSGKYSSAGMMSGSRIELEKFVRNLEGDREVNRIMSNKQILNNGNTLREKLAYGDSYSSINEVNFGEVINTRNGNKLRPVNINIHESIGENRNDLTISGVYTNNEHNNRNRQFNSFHIDRMTGNFSFDKLAYMTNTHAKTHDMISVKLDGLQNDLMKKLSLLGYGFDRDTKVTFRNSRSELKSLVDKVYPNNRIGNIFKDLLDKSDSFQEFVLNVLKTGNKFLINKLYTSGLIETYKELSNSSRLVFRTNTLSGKVTKSEKILETFEVLRDIDNDYHLGNRLSHKIENIEV